MFICDLIATTYCPYWCGFLLYYYSSPFLSQGHYVRDLGEIGEKSTENEVLLIEHDVPHAPFSQQVLNDLPTMPWIITEEVRSVINLYPKI